MSKMIAAFEVTKKETHRFNVTRAEYTGLMAAELLRRRTLIEKTKGNEALVQTMSSELETRIITLLGKRRSTQLLKSTKAQNIELVNVTIYL